MTYVRVIGRTKEWKDMLVSLCVCVDVLLQSIPAKIYDNYKLHGVSPKSVQLLARDIVDVGHNTHAGLERQPADRLRRLHTMWGRGERGGRGEGRGEGRVCVHV